MGQKKKRKKDFAFSSLHIYLQTTEEDIYDCCECLPSTGGMMPHKEACIPEEQRPGTEQDSISKANPDSFRNPAFFAKLQRIVQRP